MSHFRIRASGSGGEMYRDSDDFCRAFEQQEYKGSYVTEIFTL